MTYKEAWEAIHFRHCEETCDYAYMDNCQEGKCEYYMALQALNRQYYAECGSVWTKPLADRKTENSSEKLNSCDTCRFELYCPEMCEGCCEWDSHYEPKDKSQTDCKTCKYGQDKHRYAHICNECGVGINNYTPQTERSER